MSSPWYSLSTQEVLQSFESSDRGLSVSVIVEHQKKYGANTLPAEKVPSLFELFLEQFKSPLIYILVMASVAVFLMGDTTDGFIILFVLVFNAVVGVIQEGKAQNTLLALKKFVETKATVLRDGTEYIIPDHEVVPGDIILLQEGERIPADARVITSQGLRVDEASLTGESEPIYKHMDIISRAELPVAEQKNMLWRGTHVVAGHGRAVVVATGLSTVIGGIAKQISKIDTEIPLKTNIKHLSRAIIVAVVMISGVLFGLGVYRGFSMQEMFKTVVSLAVSIIPEGLPVVITLVLATGVWRMSKRNALVKKLQAVEALGQARVIAVDKTGTITKNELVIRKVWTGGMLFDVDGVGYEPRGEVRLLDTVMSTHVHDGLLYMGKVSALVANAQLLYDEEAQSWRISGDPTDAAMIVFGKKLGVEKERVTYASPVLAEIPFDYKLKYHASINRVDGEPLMTVVGAPEVVLGVCTSIKSEQGIQALSATQQKELEHVFMSMSAEGLRVIAIAVRNHDIPSEFTSSAINNLTFVGFFAMEDSLRPEVLGAMERAKEAGIRMVMITGDHRTTATAIAKEAGIYKDGDIVLTGEDIELMSDVELAEKLAITTVFARVTPEHKMRIINSYKKRGEVVAMTGDGVNDAPSLVAADLGVSMGKIGTEVAKEASDIVLLDDNFGSIISAIEEGRSIYRTIKNAILYLFSTSAGEVLVIAGALMLGYPLPILASQIIWLNLVTDGFLTVALAMEPKEEGLLAGQFIRPQKYIIDRSMVIRMLVMAVPMMVGTLLLFVQYVDVNIAKAWTVSLTTLAVFQWFNAWNCRSENKSIFSMKWFSNMYMVWATVIVVVLQLVAVYTPFMNTLLRTVPITRNDWVVIVAVATLIVLFEEMRKLLYRKYILVRKGDAYIL